MYLPKHLYAQTPNNTFQNYVSTNYLFSKYTIWIFYWYWKHLDTYIFLANFLSYKGEKKTEKTKKHAFEIKHCFCVCSWVYDCYFQTTRRQSTATLFNYLDPLITTWLMHEILRWEGHLHHLLFESEIITDLGNTLVKILSSIQHNEHKQILYWSNKLFTQVK